ncbi:TPA: hypothetical protein ACGXNJ_005126 [Bacillus cereus]
MKAKMTDLQRLALDVYQGKNVTFNNATGEDALRNIILDAVGGEFNFYNYQENKYKLFRVITEAVDVVTGIIVTNQFDSLAEVRNIATGDKLVFTVEDKSLFRISRVAGGNNDFRRQKLLNGNFTVDTDWFGTKIYSELEMFIAGLVDWTAMVDRIAQSYVNDMGTRIYEGIAKSYNTLNATFGVTGSYDEEKLFDMIQHVETKSQKKAVIMGTKKALRKVSKALDLSDGMKEKMNQVGYITTVSGTDLILLPQAYKVGTEEFAVDDNMLLVVPQGEKLIKIVVEGESIMLETAEAGARNDQQMEHQLMKKFGLGVVRSAVYGMYKIQ